MEQKSDRGAKQVGRGQEQCASAEPGRAEEALKKWYKIRKIEKTFLYLSCMRRTPNGISKQEKVAVTLITRRQMLRILVDIMTVESSIQDRRELFRKMQGLFQKTVFLQNSSPLSTSTPAERNLTHSVLFFLKD